MTIRTPGNYVEMSRTTVLRPDAPRVDIPRPGFYRYRLAKGAAYSAIKISYQIATDPDTGEQLDRSPHWGAWLNGEPVDVFTIWPDCSGEPISEDNYNFILAQHQWAVRHAPHEPEAKPRERVDLHTLPPIF